MKSANSKCKTPFNGNGPWAWNEIPFGGFPTRERCLSVPTESERQAAVKLIQQYRAQEEIAATHDIDGISHQLDKLSRSSQTAHGGLPGEMLRRKIREANHGTYLAAEAEKAALRNEALELMKGYLKRLGQSLDESLSASAAAAERRIESEGFAICNGESWTLHSDGVCQALWHRRLKVEKVLTELEPNSAIGCVQYFLCSEEQEPHTPFSWP
jgi:hypothetical protein